MKWKRKILVVPDNVQTNNVSNGNNIEITKEDENKVTQEEFKEDQNTLYCKQTEETETNQLNVEYDLISLEGDEKGKDRKGRMFIAKVHYGGEGGSPVLW